MEGDTSKPAVQEPPDDDKDGEHIQAEAQSDTEPFDAPTMAKVGSVRLGDIEKLTPDLKKASDDLKERIADANHRHDMPIDSALGNPDWEERAADGHLDHPEGDDD